MEKGYGDKKSNMGIQNQLPPERGIKKARTAIWNFTNKRDDKKKERITIENCWHQKERVEKCGRVSRGRFIAGRRKTISSVQNDGKKCLSKTVPGLGHNIS